jgi:hypothetical protein
MSDSNTPETPVETPATETPATDVSPDQLLRQAVEAMAPTDHAETPAEGSETETPALEASADDPAAGAGTSPETELTLAKARKILDAANRKERDARAQVEGFTNDLAQQLRQSPKATLAKLGLDIDTLIDAGLAEEGTPATSEEPDRITALEKRLQEREQSEKRASFNAKVAQIHADVSRDARFPTINARGASELVTEFMVEYFNIHGQPIGWDKAAELVEADLAPPAPKNSPAPKAEPRKANPAPAKQPSNTNTLTNNDVRTYVPPDESVLPKDPDKLIKFLVENAYAQRAA